MQFDGVFGNDESICDLLVRKTRAYEPKHLALAFGEALENLGALFLIRMVFDIGICLVGGKIKCKRIGTVDDLCALDKVDASLMVSFIRLPRGSASSVSPSREGSRSTMCK